MARSLSVMTSDSSKSRANPVAARLQANHRQFLSFLTARVGSREDAEEILQDAFVRSLQKAGDIRDGFPRASVEIRPITVRLPEPHLIRNAIKSVPAGGHTTTTGAFAPTGIARSHSRTSPRSLHGRDTLG